MNAIYSVGGIVAPLFVPWFADTIGRKKTIVIGLCIMFVGIAIQTAAVNIQMFIAGRFFIGFGSATSVGACPLLITELAHPQHRAIVTTLYNTSWYAGSTIAAWTTFGTRTLQSDWAWRAPSILQLWSSSIQILLIWFVPESPRYLTSRNKGERARDILNKYHAPSSGTELVEAEFEEIHETIELEKAFSKRKWSELWATKGNRHRMLIAISVGVFSQCSGNALVSYYINKILDSIGITDQAEQLEINGGLSVYNWIVATAICFYVDRFGRRPLFLISTAGMLCCFVAWTICSARYDISGSPGASIGVLVFIFLDYTAYGLAYNGLLVGYVVEILPFQIRAKGFAVSQISVSLALFFGNYVNPVGLQHAGWKFYILYDCWLAVELLVVYFFYVETKNTPLEEIARVFDGDDALVGGGIVPTKRELEYNHEKGDALFHNEFKQNSSDAEHERKAAA